MPAPFNSNRNFGKWSWYRVLDRKPFIVQAASLQLTKSATMSVTVYFIFKTHVGSITIFYYKEFNISNLHFNHWIRIFSRIVFDWKPRVFTNFLNAHARFEKTNNTATPKAPAPNSWTSKCVLLSFWPVQIKPIAAAVEVTFARVLYYFNYTYNICTPSNPPPLPKRLPPFIYICTNWHMHV